MVTSRLRKIWRLRNEPATLNFYRVITVCAVALMLAALLMTN